MAENPPLFWRSDRHQDDGENGLLVDTRDPKPRTNGLRLGTLRYVNQGDVGLDERRGRLEEELRTTQREGRRLGRRLETLERERAARLALIETLEADVARTAQSRSFRLGHGAMRRVSRWLLRRPARRSALDEAAELLAEARIWLGESIPDRNATTPAEAGNQHKPGPGGGLRVGFIEPHVGAVGGIRRILETSNRLIERGHEVSIYLPSDQPLECKWMKCAAQLRHIDESGGDELDFIVFNHEPQWYLLERFPGARYRVFLALSYSRAYEKSGSWESLRTPVDLLLANSRWTASRIEQEIAVQPAVVPTGIDRGLFHPRDLKKRYPAMCIGDTRPWKGTRTIEEACTLLDLELHKVHGKNLTQEDLAREYCRAEIFVVGSPIDGFGFPGLEALASGTPLVTTDNGGCREYAIHEETALIVPPGDPEAMARAISRLRSDRELRKRLIRNGVKLVEEKFSWDKAARGFERELASLAERAPDPVTLTRPRQLRPPVREPELSVIVLSYNTLELLMRCVESVRQNTDLPYELIIVDNASRDGSADYAQAAADRAIINERNAGFSGGFNQGLSVARGRLVFFLNSDTKLPPKWASRLSSTVDNCPNSGIVFPAVTAASNQLTVRDAPQDRVVTLQPYLEPPSGVALMMRTATARQLGGWNEIYEIASGEDTDLCFTVWVNGLSTVLDEAVLVDHVAKASAKQLPDQKSRWAMNRKRFLERWTGPLTDVPRLSYVTPAEFEANRQVARGVAFWMYRYFSTRDPNLAAVDPSKVGLLPTGLAVGAPTDLTAGEPDITGTPIDPTVSPGRAPVRLAWRLLRMVIPHSTRQRYYRRHRRLYEHVFPERAVPSGQANGRAPRVPPATRL